MKRSFFNFVFSLFLFSSSAQCLLIENFDYPLESGIFSQGWNIHSGANKNDSITVADGLSFTNYIGSGIGGAALIDGGTADMSKQFTAQTSGTIYAAFLMKASDKNSKGYFFHLSPTVVGNSHYARLWINASGNGVGIGADEPTIYYSITANTTYFLVAKYDFTSKLSSLFVLSQFSSSEPDLAQCTFTETANITSIGSVALRQYSTAENVIVDGIRVATSWAQLFADTTTDITQLMQNEDRVYVWNRSMLIPEKYIGEEMKIYSIAGTCLLKCTVKDNNIDVSKLLPSIYVVKVGEKVQKVLIE